MSLPSPEALPLFKILFVGGCDVHWIVFLRLRCQRQVVLRRHQFLCVVASGARFWYPRPSLRPKAARAVQEEPRVRVRRLLLLVVVVVQAGAGFVRPWPPISADGNLRFHASFQHCAGADSLSCRGGGTAEDEEEVVVAAGAGAAVRTAASAVVSAAATAAAAGWGGKGHCGLIDSHDCPLDHEIEREERCTLYQNPP